MSPAAIQSIRYIPSVSYTHLRFHQLDAEWSTPNLFQFTKGQRLDNTRSLDPRSLERLDYLIYCLKEEGIYVYLDMLCYRRFKENDGLENTHLMPDAGRPYTNFSRRMIELQKEFNSQLWNHYNPYTKLCYKDEPAIIFSEITNENDLFCFNTVLEPYKTELLKLFAAWAEKKGLPYTQENIQGLDLNDWENLDLAQFKCDVMKDYYREMIEDCRKIGVKIPITGTNWTKNAAILEAQMVTDYVDTHGYAWFGDCLLYTSVRVVGCTVCSRPVLHCVSNGIGYPNVKLCAFIDRFFERLVYLGGEIGFHDPVVKHQASKIFRYGFHTQIPLLLVNKKTKTPSMQAT